MSNALPISDRPQTIPQVRCAILDCHQAIKDIDSILHGHRLTIEAAQRQIDALAQSKGHELARLAALRQDLAELSAGTRRSS